MSLSGRLSGSSADFWALNAYFLMEASRLSASVAVASCASVSPVQSALVHDVGNSTSGWYLSSRTAGASNACCRSCSALMLAACSASALAAAISDASGPSACGFTAFGLVSRSPPSTPRGCRP
eukprot:CAMPEP_0182933170 /NCGR_PEP_ID=MMETSP0105_2-20130417/33200_1 /TAXON_ID=81532 ORGANISM="Acanthoeca-like sp., Strain 10tr" /NCGR_SAMPLE_ID=MMETSP0105_2 /ASSEMBLY_ACC=CAM_ASM_000205 /LENGTH=122 /DNA_ID=CAMNT_0025071857 /DNA_START=118 /DNA_END=486 /DNA_ORIENTATION=+